jgi:hypothetical protein
MIAARSHRFLMPGLVPGIPISKIPSATTGIAGTSPAMTACVDAAPFNS